MGDASRFAIVFAGDEGFAAGLAVSVYSTLSRLAPDCRPQVFVLDNGLSRASRARLQDMVEASHPDRRVEWIEIPPDKRLEPFATDSRLTPSTYSRLLIPELMPATTERAIYLDADL